MTEPTRSGLLSALADLETAALALQSAHAAYLTAFAAANGEAFDGSPARSTSAAVEAQLSYGPGRVYGAFVPRLRQLGLGPLLDHGRAGGRLDETWAADLAAQINRA